MRLLFAVLCSAVFAMAQNPMTACFPNASDSCLGVFWDATSTVTTQSLSAGATSVTVANGAAAKIYQWVAIERTDLVQITNIVGNTWTITATGSSHSSGVQAQGTLLSRYINQAFADLISISTAWSARQGTIDLLGNIAGMWTGGVLLTNSGSPSTYAFARLPADFDKTRAVTVRVMGLTTAGSSGTVRLNAQIGCFGSGQAIGSLPTLGAASVVTITQAASVTSQADGATALTLPGACDYNVMAALVITRDNTVGGNLVDTYQLLDVALTYYRR